MSQNGTKEFATITILTMHQSVNPLMFSTINIVHTIPNSDSTQKTKNATISLE